MLTASIIISTYNYPDALDLVLSSLILQMTAYPETEILIADDGSDAATLSVIEKHQRKLPTIKHIWHADQGFQKATILNKAVAESTGNYLIFLDGDCIPFLDYVQTQLAFAEKHYFVAGHRILLSRNFTSEIIKNKALLNHLLNATGFNWLNYYVQKKANKLMPKINNAYLKNILKKIRYFYRHKTRWLSPKGCNFAVFRDDFFSVNGFDEKYQGWGHEDSDLFIRLIHRGIVIKDAKFFIPVMHLWHPLAERNKASDNYQTLIKRANDASFVRADKGINQYVE